MNLKKILRNGRSNYKFCIQYRQENNLFYGIISCMFYEYEWKFSSNFDGRFQNLSQTSTEENDRFSPQDYHTVFTKPWQIFHTIITQFSQTDQIVFKVRLHFFHKMIILFSQNKSQNILKIVHSSHNIMTQFLHNYHTVFTEWS